MSKLKEWWKRRKRPKSNMKKPKAKESKQSLERSILSAKTSWTWKSETSHRRHNSQWLFPSCKKWQSVSIHSTKSKSLSRFLPGMLRTPTKNSRRIKKKVSKMLSLISNGLSKYSWGPQGKSYFPNLLPTKSRSSVKMQLKQKISSLWQKRASLIEIFASFTQLKTFTCLVMSWARQMPVQVSCFRLSLNSAHWISMMHIKLQSKRPHMKRISIQPKAIIFSCWIEVDQWEDQESKKLNRLWFCF